MKPDFVFPNNPEYLDMAVMRDDLSFVCEGQQQRITLILPAKMAQKENTERYPLVVFLQGSGWTAPNRFTQLPQLCAYAQKGIAIASITHRNSLEGNPFPAYLKDAKAAIRFLRSIKDELKIDENRIGFFGTSSGGNTALLIGLTADDPRYETEDYKGYSDRVACVVDCFGPSDLIHFEGGPLTSIAQLGQLPDLETLKTMYQGGDNGLLDIMFSLFGQENPLNVLKAMSPTMEIKEGQHYPPFLIAQGTKDDVVPYSQSLMMHEALKAAQADSTLIEITGAEHEGTFWSARLHEAIFSFLQKHLAQ